MSKFYRNFVQNQRFVRINRSGLLALGDGGTTM